MCSAVRRWFVQHVGACDVSSRHVLFAVWRLRMPCRSDDVWPTVLSALSSEACRQQMYCARWYLLSARRWVPCHSISSVDISPQWSKAVITIAIRLRYDYDLTTTYRARLLPFDAIRREQKINTSIFRHSLVVVVSQSNRNFDYFRRSRMRRGIVVS